MPLKTTNRWSIDGKNNSYTRPKLLSEGYKMVDSKEA